MSATFDRRTFLRTAAAAGAAASVPLLPGAASAATGATASADSADDLDPAARPSAAWFAGRGCGNRPGPRGLPQDAAADRILRCTQRPRIPRRDFRVTDIAVTGDGTLDAQASDEA